MEHIINGYKINGTILGEEISQLRRDVSNQFSRKIYEALDVRDYINGASGVSGNGYGRKFNLKELNLAYDHLKDDPELYPEQKFIINCLEHVNDIGEVYIAFGQI